MCAAFRTPIDMNYVVDIGTYSIKNVSAASTFEEATVVFEILLTYKAGQCTLDSCDTEIDYRLIVTLDGCS